MLLFKGSFVCSVGIKNVHKRCVAHPVGTPNMQHPWSRDEAMWGHDGRLNATDKSTQKKELYQLGIEKEEMGSTHWSYGSRGWIDYFDSARQESRPWGSERKWDGYEGLSQEHGAGGESKPVDVKEIQSKSINSYCVCYDCVRSLFEKSCGETWTWSKDVTHRLLAIKNDEISSVGKY